MKPRYIPNDYRQREYKNANALICFAEKENKFYAMGYSGKRSKPDFNYRFKTLEHCEKYINDYLKTLTERSRYKQEQADKKKEIRKNFKNPLQVGDIVYTSWGWEQTNIDFYQVVETVGKSTVKLRALCCEDVGNNQGHFMSATKIPVKDKFWGSEILTKRVSPMGENGFYITISSCETAFAWDGKPKNYSWYG